MKIFKSIRPNKGLYLITGIQPIYIQRNSSVLGLTH